MIVATHRSTNLHVANHNQPLNGGLTMTNPDIQRSQHLLKRLKEEIEFLESLAHQIQFQISQVKLSHIEVFLSVRAIQNSD